MKYLIVLVMCILASMKVNIQSAFSKKNVNNTADAIFFSGMFFAFSALLFMPKIAGCSPAVWIYAFFAAVFTVGFQLTYTVALSMGNVSITVLITNFSMVIMSLVSYFIYGEALSALRISGIILTLIAFILCTDFKSSEKKELKWFLLSFSALICTSLGSVAQKVFGESQFCDENQAFVSCMYIVATVVTAFVYLIYAKRGNKKTFPLTLKPAFYAMGVGVTLAVFQAINTYAIATIDGTFLFPMFSGGVVLFATISGLVLFKDKLTLKQFVSIAVGLAAIVLMNF